MMYILIVLVITASGSSSMSNVRFNSSVSCLEAMAKVLEFERHPSVKVVKAQCVKK